MAYIGQYTIQILQEHVMKKLVIDNIGPINHVELNMKRVNVIIGPQSAGKSCILKIACFCAWAEKRIQLEQSKNGFSDFNYVIENLIVFHRLSGFLRNGSMISYKTDQLSFLIDFDKKTFNLTWGSKNKRYSYIRSRVSYIPAERNLVSSIPNWFDVKMDSTNLKSFISDWNYSHKLCTGNSSLPIINLGVDYVYDTLSDADYVKLDNGKQIDLSNASSGLQSVIPMWVYLDYLFRKQYSPNEMSSSKTETENEEIAQHIYDSKYKKGIKKAGESGNLYFGKVGVTKRMFASKEDFEEFKSLVHSYTLTDHADIYLEEPEQNLFPQTQVELIYDLLKNSSVHKDSIFIATHSPYVLYALNNCMLGYIVGEKHTPEDLGFKVHSDSWINPKDVAVWELRDGGFSSKVDTKFLTLQDNNGLIRDNYFDRVMKSIMSEFTNLVSFYE